jgi:FMN-dependent NADH-azoreductase
MNDVLFVNACIRKEGQSRTLKIARKFIEEYKKLNPDDSITELKLCDLDLRCITGDMFEQREQLLQEGNLNHESFNLAKQFANADKIIIAAPFWELSFPAVLRVYIEHISVVGITFEYEDNQPVGLCKAKKVLYITTRGGEYSHGFTSEFEMGERFIKAICLMYGIENVITICAEGLDMVENNADEIVNKAIDQAVEIAKNF